MVEVVPVQIVHFIFKRKCKIFIGARLNAPKKKGSSLKGKLSLPLKVREGLENSTVSGDTCSCRSVRNQQLDCVLLNVHNLSKPSVGNTSRLT